MSLPWNQSSDYVVHNILSKHNCKIKKYCTYNKKPYFTQEKNNIFKINRFTLNGSRNKSFAIKKIKKKGMKDKVFVISKKIENKLNKPREMYDETIIFDENKDEIKNEINNITSTKYYRSDLKHYLEMGIWQMKCNDDKYQILLKKENEADNDDENNDDNDNENENENKESKAPAGDDIELVD
mmetsp:Transcript_77035/g.94489  ORF Transcript_77035/g.94489 Transcript_77035/m.94489 type:complete len:183 (+) Transcript_77035:36-584(+)